MLNLLSNLRNGKVYMYIIYTQIHIRSTSKYIDIWEYLLFLLHCTSTGGPGYIHLDNGVSLVPKGNLLPFPVLLASATEYHYGETKK